MALVTTIGGLTLVTVAAIWGLLKLVKWDISTEKDLKPARVVRVWVFFVVVVLLVELGPPLANTVVNVLNAIL